MRAYHYFLLTFVFLICGSSLIRDPSSQKNDQLFFSHLIYPKNKNLSFHWTNPNGSTIGSISELKNKLERNGKKLLFATNGGMYQKDQSPQGLYIEKRIVKHKVNQIKKAYGNFYMQPNGVFMIDTNWIASIVVTDSIKNLDRIQYATQSGPMLLIDGSVHPKFQKGSKNLHIRNAVGIMPCGACLFVLSKRKVNFYDLAMFFKEKGCKNALYLDGFVSRMYCLEKGVAQLDGQFGVIIAESE